MLTEIPRQESHGLGLYCVQKSKALFKRMRTSGKAGTKQRSLSQSALWVQIQEQVHDVEWKSQFMVGAFVRFLGKQRQTACVWSSRPPGSLRPGRAARALQGGQRRQELAGAPPPSVEASPPLSADRRTWQVFVGETAWRPDRTRARTVCAMLRDVRWSPAPLCGGRVPGEEAH